MTKFSAGMQRVGLGYCPFLGGGSVVVVVDLLINTLPIVCGSSVFVFAIIWKRERKLVALLLIY